MANAFCEKSDEYWTVGQEFVEQGCLNTAAHCLYYAVFQAVYGFAEANEMAHVTGRDVKSKHTAVLGVIGEHHRAENCRAARRLHAARIKADYKVEGVTRGDLPNECLRAAETVRQYFLNFERRTE